MDFWLQEAPQRRSYVVDLGWLVGLRFNFVRLDTIKTICKEFKSLMLWA